MGTYANTETVSVARLSSVVRWLKRLPNRLGFLAITFVLRPTIIRWLIHPERLFIVYPEKEKYADAFTFKWMREQYMKNSPWIGGIYRQNGKWGIMAVIYVLPGEFNKDRLDIVHKNVEILQERIGAKSVSYAGTMPGKMKAFGIRKNTLETQLTAKSVVKAVQQLRRDHIVVLLGGNGHTGRIVDLELRANGIPTAVVDLPADGKGKVNYKDWPLRKEKIGKGDSPFLLLNLISGKDLKLYLPLMRKGDLLLNEAYPAPCEEVIRAFSEKGIECHHIVGVKPFLCFPSFPGEYHGAVPCCGMIPGDAPVVVRNISLSVEQQINWQQAA